MGEIRSGLRGDSLPLGLGTLGGGTVGDFQGEGIGKAMLGIDSLGTFLSSPNFLDKSNNFCLRTLGSSAWGTLLGSCARIVSFSPLQPCSASRSSVIAVNCASHTTVGEFCKAPVRVCIP